VFEGAADGHRDAPPDAHVTWVVVLYVVVLLVQLPVHVAGDDVGALVVVPHERGVDLLHVLVDSKLRDPPALPREVGLQVVAAERPETVALGTTKNKDICLFALPFHV